MFIGHWEILLIVGLAVVLFGGRKLPQLGAGLGQGIRNFKESLSSDDEKKIENKAEAETSKKDAG